MKCCTEDTPKISHIPGAALRPLRKPCRHPQQSWQRLQSPAAGNRRVISEVTGLWAAKTGALISNTVADAEAASSIQTWEVRNYQVDLFAGSLLSFYSRTSCRLVKELVSTSKCTNRKIVLNSHAKWLFWIY